jgi:hypothetical protein
MREGKMRETIVFQVLGFLGVLLFAISHSIFTNLPANSEYAGVFALLSIVGLGLVLVACCFAQKALKPGPQRGEKK